MTHAFIVPPGQRRRLDLGDFEALVLATAAQRSRGLHAAAGADRAAGVRASASPSPGHGRAFYVLEGDYLMYVEDRQQLCPQGTFVYVPRDTPHTFEVVSVGPGKKLVLFSLAAMLGYFEALAAADAAGNATPDLLAAIAASNNMKVLGPVPDAYL